MLLSGVFSLCASLVPVSAAARAQDEDGAEGSTGRTDTSSSVSISNSISSCEVTKIVRMPPCLPTAISPIVVQSWHSSVLALPQHPSCDPIQGPCQKLP